MKTAHSHDSVETRNKKKDIFIDPQPSLLFFSPSVFIKLYLSHLDRKNVARRMTTLLLV